MAWYASIVPSLKGLFQGVPTILVEKLASILLVPVNDNGAEDMGMKARLQYFPETLSDSHSPEWEPKMIPGGSHPLYNWVAGGERQISFTAYFTQERRLTNPLGGSAQGPFGPILTDKWSVDVMGAIAWLRQFTYPTYGSDGQAHPPPRVRLVAPNALLGEVKGTILAIMQSCDVEWLQWWPDGTPKEATASLTFAEVVQTATSVQFQGRKFLRDIAKGYTQKMG
jgi:hypothetical protein